MPQQTNLNVSPYYADYTPLSDYYKVLYKAGSPIQARELTNTQLMLQNQIEQIASRTLKEGDNIVPGEFVRFEYGDEIQQCSRRGDTEIFANNMGSKFNLPVIREETKFES